MNRADDRHGAGLSGPRRPENGCGPEAFQESRIGSSAAAPIRPLVFANAAFARIPPGVARRNGGRSIAFPDHAAADDGYGKFYVGGEYVRKHNPQVGGYYVVYEDGYKSFSPADAFEGGHSRI
ncbi:hypothetical protein ABIB82_002205 [Bradyrhizobium sp. i1.8.4]|uniref:hypothetical protein n=1 Tax=unclassified Bradyrhizobium TaxID=2631580 RepID=UPI003D255FA7